jgi:uncharacterized membrane protein YbaN (DUF454 family)
LRVKNIVLTSLGFLLLFIGAIGLVLPVLPTTPFVLAAAACFSCSPRIKARVMNIPFFREHIENYEKRTGLSNKTLIISLSYLWGMLLLSMFLAKIFWLTVFLSIVGVCVTIHILMISKAGRKKRGDR